MNHCRSDYKTQLECRNAHRARHREGLLMINSTREELMYAHNIEVVTVSDRIPSTFPSVCLSICLSVAPNVR
jgi:hypothetical protein